MQRSDFENTGQKNWLYLFCNTFFRGNSYRHFVIGVAFVIDSDYGTSLSLFLLVISWLARNMDEVWIKAKLSVDF